MDNRTDFIATDLYDHYLEEFDSLTPKEQEDEGPVLSREEYYNRESSPVDFFRYSVSSIGPWSSMTLYELDAHSCKWTELLELFRSTEPESWNHKFYANYRVLDGCEWTLQVQIDGKQYIAEGRNAWPNELDCSGGGHLRSDILELLEKDVDPYAAITDCESIGAENEMPEVTRSSADESEEEVVKTKPHIIPRGWRPSTFSKPLVKLADVIFYKDKPYFLLSDPVGQCVLNGSIVARPNYGDGIDKLFNLEKRGFYVEWIVDGNQLKILNFIGPYSLTYSLENGLYLRHYDFRRGERFFKSRYEWCRRFAIFSGELKLYDYEQMLDASELGWLLGPKDNITLTVKAGEVVQERASKTYYRPNPFMNLSYSFNPSLDEVFFGIVGYVLLLFFPLWVKFWQSWSFDGLSYLCFCAFQIYWIYGVLKTLHGDKPDWVKKMASNKKVSP